MKTHSTILAIIGCLLTLASHAQIQTAPPVFVDVDATGLSPGPLISITNSGSVGGFFYARGGGTTVPLAAPVDGGGTMGIRFDGGDYLQHVATLGGAIVPAPAGLVGANPTCTIEAWVLNGAIDREETILGWGKRAFVQTQSHRAFNYGWDAAWGAMAHWDAATCMGWTSGLDGGGVYSTGVPSAGIWHHLVYTFDGTTQRVYADGALKNSEVISLTIASGPPINIAAQTESDGSTVTATLRGSMTIGRLRVHDGVLTANQIATNYLLEVSAFTNGPGTQLVSSPAHRYQFDNAVGAATAGSILTDSVGGANGTVLGTGATFTGNRLTLPGGASGTAAYVDLPDGLLSGNSTNKGGSGEVTIEGWVKITGNRTWSRIFDFGSSSGGSGQDNLFYGAQVNTDVHTHRLDVKNVDAVGGTGGGGTIDHGSTTFGTNLHFAITWNDATGEMRIFENGEFVARRTETARLTQLNDVNVWLGRSQYTGDQNLQGEFDEFRMYNRILSDAELRGNFLRGPSNIVAQLTTFTLTGGGAGCGSVPVGLSGSEVGVTYLLRTNSAFTGVSIEGTGSAINFGNQTLGASYSVLASNTTTAVTALMNGSAVVTITVPPSITSGPSPATFTNYQGGYLSFAIAATGSSLNYQWRRDGTNLTNGGRISGATSNRLTIFPADPADSVNAGHGYVCVVSNSCGQQISSEATATIIPFTAIPETVVGVWTNHFIPTNTDSGVLSVLADRGGNIIAIGYSDGATPGYYRVTAIKYSAAGISLWTNDNNGMLEDQDLDPVASLDGSGNLFVAKGSSQIVVDKYSGTNGLLLWEKRFGSVPNQVSPRGLAVDDNGNAVFTGAFSEGQTTYHTNYSYTAKLAAADGSLLWERFHGPWESAQGVVVDTGGDVVITGGRSINGVKNEALTVKYSGVDGTQIWETQAQSPGLESSRPNAIAFDAAGNIAIAGYTDTNSTSYLYTAKYAAANGALLWERGHTVGPAARNYAIAMDADGNVVTTGQDNFDSYIAKYAAADGSLLWDRRYHDPNNRSSFFTAIAADANNDVVVTGWAGYGQDPFTGNSTLTSDIYTAKYAGENGAVLWSTRFNGLANRDDTTALFQKSIAITPAGEVVVAGSTDGGFVFPVPYSSHWVTIKFSSSAPNARPLVLNPIPDTNGIYGTPFNFTFAANTFSDSDAGQTLTYSASGLPFGITFTPATRTFSGTPTNIGTISVTVSATDDGSSPLSTNDVFDIVIAKAPLTATADNLSRNYAETNPPLTFSYSSFVLGEGASVLDTLPIADTPATNGSPVGPYPITLAGGSDDHYEFSYVGATLIITSAPLIATAFDTNRVYGTPNPPLAGSLVGVAWGENITVTFETAATITDPPGVYPITPLFSDPDSKLGNYSVTTYSGTLTITSPAELSFTLGGDGGGLFTLSWPASPAGFLLEYTESLTPPIVWQEVTSGIGESDGVKSYTVVNDSNAPGRLYRLRLP
jgi:hypothetical protein